MTPNHPPVRLAATLAAALLGAGACTNLNIAKHADSIEQTKQQVEDIESEHRQAPADQQDITGAVTWPRQEAFLHAPAGPMDYSLPLRAAVMQLLPGQPVAWRLPPGLNPKVSANPHSDTVRDHLDSMAMQANVHWTYATGTLVFTPTRTHQYEIPLYGGAINAASVGTNNLSGESTGATNDLTLTTSLRTELDTLIRTTLQIGACPEQQTPAPAAAGAGNATESARTLTGIPRLAPPAPITECYAISGAGNLVTVTARPHTLVQFDQAFEGYLASLHRNVKLKIITVRIDVTDLSQQRLDLDLLYENSTLNLEASNINNDLTTSSNLAIASSARASGATLTGTLSRASSNWLNSRILLQNLDTISNMAVTDSREVLAYSNRLITIQDTERFSYVKEIRREIETIGNTTGIRTSIESDELYTGEAINILPSLTADTIGLHIVVNESSLTNVKTDGTEEASITLPDTANSDVVFDVTLQDGEAALIASSIRKETSTKEDKSGLLPLPLLDRFLSNSNEGQSRVYQTLYLIEASFRR